jgi:hypothetical protein
MAAISSCETKTDKETLGDVGASMYGSTHCDEALIVQVPDPSLLSFLYPWRKSRIPRQLPCAHAERLVMLDIRAKLFVK